MEATAQSESLLELGKLPTLPSVAYLLIRSATGEHVNVKDLSDLIKSDPAISAKILQTANAPYYGFRGKVETIERAVSLIGLTAVRSIVLGLTVFNCFSIKKETESLFDPWEFWKHSLGCALAAEFMAKRVGYEVTSPVFMAGLLHDLGRLAMYSTQPEQYEQVIREARESSATALQRERAIFGADHTVYGQRLAEIWNLPEVIAQSMRRHHAPLPRGRRQGGGRPSVDQLVCVADAFVRNLWIGTQDEDIPVPIDAEVWHFLGMTAQDERGITQELVKGIQQVAPIFDREVDMATLHTEALFKANDTLSRTSVELEQQRALLQRELDSSRFSKALYENFRPGLDVSETLESATRVICNVLKESKTLGMVWEPGAPEARLAVCEGPNPVICFQGLRLSESVHPDVSSEERLRCFLTAYERGMTEQSLQALESECRLILLPFGCLQAIGGGIVIDMRQRTSPIPEWIVVPLSRFVGLAETAVERAWLYEDLQRRMDELDKAHKKAEIFHEQLNRTDRLLAVGSLAAGIAHEVNNPLTIIGGQVQVLMESERDEDRRNRLRTVFEQTARITRTVGKMVDLARPHRPKVLRTQIKELIQDLTGMFRHRYMKRQIRIVEDLATDLPPVHLDADGLQQVLVNLLINAEHAMTHPGVVTLRARTGFGGQTMVIEVEDTGVGIPRENLERIFDEFFTTKEPGKGTGLGLHTSKRLIEEMGGNLKVHSQLGQGTCFTIHLPMAVKNEPLRILEEKRHNRTMRILIVDDEPVARDLIREALSDHAYIVKMAVDGRDAVQMVCDEAFDCILLDLVMPRMDGIEFLDWLHSEKAPVKKPLPSVIAVTGVAEADRREEALVKGAVACVRKPFAIEAIINEIETAITKRLIDRSLGAGS